MKIHRSYYKEYLFFFGTDEQATGEGALGQQVDDLLAANVAPIDQVTPSRFIWLIASSGLK